MQKAAQNGIWAALLARHDYLGSRTALEGEWGFLRAFAKGSDADRLALLDRLGEEWYILRTISKPYACCLSSHAGITALHHWSSAALQAPGTDPGGAPAPATATVRTGRQRRPTRATAARGSTR